MSIKEVAYQLAAQGKGILAADESTATIKKRLESIGVESSEETRRDYREMLFTSDEAMRNYISGVILYDETLRQKAKDGTAFVEILRRNGVIPGIKVDKGTKAMAGFKGELMTEGLDGLRERLQDYYELGARFAKWRAVIAIDQQNLPHHGAVCQTMHGLAAYAALCQEANIVPIVEPEVLMDGHPGTHSIDRCYEVTKGVLRKLFETLYEARVDLEAMVLKPNMVIDGQKWRQASVEEVAEKTVKCLKASVPALVPSITFLSGGQSDLEATAHLNFMNAHYDLPWNVSYSYGRALQAAALKSWAGKANNVIIAQKIFTHRAKMNSLAVLGQWSQEQE